MYDGYSQELILNLLTATMTDQELWIGPFKPLNVLTASEVYIFVLLAKLLV